MESAADGDPATANKKIDPADIHAPIWKHLDNHIPRLAVWLDQMLLRLLGMGTLLIWNVCQVFGGRFNPRTQRLKDTLRGRLTTGDPAYAIATCTIYSDSEKRWLNTPRVRGRHTRLPTWASRLWRATCHFGLAATYILALLLTFKYGLKVARTDLVMRYLRSESKGHQKHMHVEIAPVEPLSRPSKMLEFLHAFMRAPANAYSGLQAQDSATKDQVRINMGMEPENPDLRFIAPSGDLEDANKNNISDAFERHHNARALKALQQQRELDNMMARAPHKYKNRKEAVAAYESEYGHAPDDDDSEDGIVGGGGMFQDVFTAISNIFTPLDDLSESEQLLAKAKQLDYVKLDEERLLALSAELAALEPAGPSVYVCEMLSQYRPSTSVMMNVQVCWDQLQALIDKQFNIDWFVTRTQRSLMKDHVAIKAILNDEAVLQEQHARAAGRRARLNRRTANGQRRMSDSGQIVDDNGAVLSDEPQLICINNVHFGIAEPFVIMSYPGTPSRIFIDPELVSLEEVADGLTPTEREAIKFGMDVARATGAHSPPKPEQQTPPASGFDLARQQEARRERERANRHGKHPYLRSHKDTYTDDDEQYATDYHPHLDAAGTEASEDDLGHRTHLNERREIGGFRTSDLVAPRVYRADKLFHRGANFSALVEYPSRARIAYKTIPSAQTMVDYFGPVNGETYAALREAEIQIAYDLKTASPYSSDGIFTQIVEAITPDELGAGQLRALTTSYNKRLDSYFTKNDQCRSAKLRQLKETSGKQHQPQPEGGGGLRKLMNPLGVFGGLLGTDSVTGKPTAATPDEPLECNPTALFLPKLVAVRGEQLRDPEEMACFASAIAANQMLRKRRDEYTDSQVRRNPKARDPMGDSILLKDMSHPTPRELEFIELYPGSTSRQAPGNKHASA